MRFHKSLSNELLIQNHLGYTKFSLSFQRISIASYTFSRQRCTERKRWICQGQKNPLSLFFVIESSLLRKRRDDEKMNTEHRNMICILCYLILYLRELQRTHCLLRQLNNEISPQINCYLFIKGPPLKPPFRGWVAV